MPFVDTTRYTVQFVDEMHGWVMGSRGSLLRTTDGGTTWVEHLIPTNSSVATTRFVDPIHGWTWVQRCAHITSHCIQNELYRTSDGGVTWVRTGFPDSIMVLGRALNRLNPNDPSNIDFPDSSTVIVSGYRQFLRPPYVYNELLWYFSTDAGTSWNSIRPAYQFADFVEELFARDVGNWVMFRYRRGDHDLPSQTRCRLSNDTGKTWRDVSASFDGVAENIWKADEKHFIIFSSEPTMSPRYSGTFVTSDGGETWNTFPYLWIAKMGVMPQDTTLWAIELHYDPYPYIADFHNGYLYRTHPFTARFDFPPHSLMYPEKVRWIDHVGSKVYALTSSGSLILFDDLAVSVEKPETPPEFTSPSIISIAPNPCTATTQLTYETNAHGALVFTIWNALGVKVRELPAREQSAPGRYSFEIGMEGLADGLYFLSVGSSRGTETKRFVKFR